MPPHTMPPPHNTPKPSHVTPVPMPCLLTSHAMPLHDPLSYSILRHVWSCHVLPNYPILFHSTYTSVMPPLPMPFQATLWYHIPYYAFFTPCYIILPHAMPRRSYQSHAHLRHALLCNFNPRVSEDFFLFLFFFKDKLTACMSRIFF